MTSNANITALSRGYGRSRSAPERSRDLAWEQASGWTLLDRWSDKATCWRWVLGKRHAGPYCPCQEGRPEWPIWDHVRRVRNPVGARGLLLEPFWFDAERAADLTTWCEARGLTWAVNGFSPYSPGRTVALVVTEAVPTAHPWQQGHALPWPERVAQL